MATYTFDKIEYGGNTYVVSDSGALQLTGGQVTGPVTFGDLVSIDEATVGDLVVNGSASFTNNIQANTINGVTVGSSPKFTDTNTEVSTLTLASGSTAGTALAYGGKYTLTAGSKTVSFTMPSTDNTNTTYTFANGTNGFTVTPSGGTAQTVTVTPSITNNVTGSGTSGKVVKFTGTNTIGDGWDVTDNTASTAVTSSDTNLITGRTLYYAGYTKNTGTITGVTAGTGMSGGGTSGSITLNHSNSVTAQTTQAVYPIKIDAQGHISAYGSAITPLTAHQTIKQDGVTGATANRFGTCDTAAGTAAKTVSITTGTFALEAGSMVTVKFTNANTANSPTLNVGSTGAKNIFHRNAQITSGTNKALLSGVVLFIYDGTQWHLIDGHYVTANTTNVGSASAGTAISADDITAWTTNTPTSVTKKTVVTGGSTTAIPNVTAVGSVPSLSYTARSVGSASGWSAGTAASASYSAGVLTLTNGTAPSLTITSTDCDDITSWSAGSTPTLGTAINAYTSLTTGDSVSVTAGTAASLSYTSRSIPNISVTSTSVANGVTLS